MFNDEDVKKRARRDDVLYVSSYVLLAMAKGLQFNFFILFIIVAIYFVCITAEDLCA